MKMKSIRVIWNQGPIQGEIKVRNGRVRKVDIIQGLGSAGPRMLNMKSRGESIICITIDDVMTSPGGNSTIVTIPSARTPFSFFLRDINEKTPVYIPEYDVVVTDHEDKRSFREIRSFIENKKLVGALQRMSNEPEESYENAAAATRSLPGPTWLGVGRDFRLFEVYFEDLQDGFNTYIIPRFHSVLIPESHNTFNHSYEIPAKEFRYRLLTGRGVGCVKATTRHLSDGHLPILHIATEDGNIRYETTLFPALEKKSLTAKNVKGTHHVIADGHTGGHVLSEVDKKTLSRLHKGEMRKKETVVLYVNLQVVNKGTTPSYAWFSNLLVPFHRRLPFKRSDGLGIFEENNLVFCLSRLNGKPWSEDEMAVCLQPGEKVSCDFFIPHQPISRKRSSNLSKVDIKRKERECVRYWKKKSTRGGTIHVPEKVINNMIRAGLIHLDITTLGREREGILVPTVGRYAAIGTESAPIIQFFDSMGWHDTAEHSLQFFLEKQRDNGFIQSYKGYMAETGAVLWSMGEHYRHTRDDHWIQINKERIQRACDFLLKWRESGMIDSASPETIKLQKGKVADPEDKYYAFMLNGYSYLGLKRAAEMTHAVDTKLARHWESQAQRYRRDIRSYFLKAMGESPVLPLSNGTWGPSAPPWCGQPGPVCLYAEGGKWHTHETFLARDSLIGPLYLVFQEVFNPDEMIADFLLNYHVEHMCERNVAFSQPYYSRHPFLHLHRGEVKAFLKAYYNGLTSLADRETYSWWEHFTHHSPHKTHEEAWFLMQSRWMLWMEMGADLCLLRGIPRHWLLDGNCIELKNVSSYFGHFHFVIESRINDGHMRVTWNGECHHRLREIRVRVPHPFNQKAVKIQGGTYLKEQELVVIQPVEARHDVDVYF